MAVEVRWSRSHWGTAVAVGVAGAAAYALLIVASIEAANVASGGSCAGRCDAPERFGKSGLMVVIAVPLDFVAIALWTILMLRVIWTASGRRSGRVVDRAINGAIVIVVTNTMALAVILGSSSTTWLWPIGATSWLIVPGLVGTWLMRAQQIAAPSPR